MAKKKRIQLPRNGNYPYIEMDYVRGGELYQLSDKWEVPIGTLNTWHRKYEWSKKRKEYQAKIKSAVFNRLVDSIEKSSERYLQCSLLISQIGLEALMQIHEGAVPTRQHQLPLLKQWMSLIKDGGGLIRTVLPEADDYKAEGILKNLKELNEEFTPKSSKKLPGR